MSAQKSGRESPPPETQTGAQQQDAPSSGHGVNRDAKNQNQDQSKADLETLRSNPKGPLDNHIDELAKKVYHNVGGEMKGP